MPLNLFGSGATASIERKQAPSLFRGANVADVVPVMKQNVIRDYRLTLTVAPTLTAGNNTVANTLNGDEWAYVSKIRVVANGSDVLCDISGNTLWWINRIVYGLNPRVTPGVGDGATANVPIVSTLILPQWLLRCRKPMDGAYETWRVNNLQIEITYATFTAMNASASAFTTNPSMEIMTSEVEPTATFIPPVIPITQTQILDFSGAQTNGRFVLDTGPFYRAFLINASTVNTGASDLPTTITNVKLVAGSSVLRDYSWATLVVTGEIENSVPNMIEFATTGIATAGHCRISGTSDPKAWGWMNICKDGALTEAISTPTSNDLFLEFATSGAVRIAVTSFKFLPNPNWVG